MTASKPPISNPIRNIENIFVPAAFGKSLQTVEEGSAAAGVDEPADEDVKEEDEEEERGEEGEGGDGLVELCVGESGCVGGVWHIHIVSVGLCRIRRVVELLKKRK